MNEIILGDSAKEIEKLPDGSIDLVVTSPPYYNAKTEYAEYVSMNGFMTSMSWVFHRLKTKLKPGARVCINTASGYGRSPYTHLGVGWINVMLNMNYEMRGEIVWDKGASVGSSTAWGSWMSPSSPSLRDQHEMIYVFDYGGHRLEGDATLGTIEKEEFLEATKSIWRFSTARDEVHPAVMPYNLARRLVELYSYKENVVLDPFCGSGTTCIAAMDTGRNYIGIDYNGEYVTYARKRLASHRFEF